MTDPSFFCPVSSLPLPLSRPAFPFLRRIPERMRGGESRLRSSATGGTETHVDVDDLPVGILDCRIIGLDPLVMDKLRCSKKTNINPRLLASTFSALSWNLASRSGAARARARRRGSEGGDNNLSDNFFQRHLVNEQKQSSQLESDELFVCFSFLPAYSFFSLLSAPGNGTHGRGGGKKGLLYRHRESRCCILAFYWT